MEQNDSIVVAVGGDFTTEVVDKQGMLAKRCPSKRCFTNSDCRDNAGCETCRYICPTTGLGFCG